MALEGAVQVAWGVLAYEEGEARSEEGAKDLCSVGLLLPAHPTWWPTRPSVHPVPFGLCGISLAGLDGCRCVCLCVALSGALGPPVDLRGRLSPRGSA